MRQKTLILQEEPPYPDGKGILFICTEGTLRELSGALDRLSHLPTGARIDFEYCRRNSPDCMGALAFAKCSQEKHEELLAPDLKARVTRFVAPHIAIPALIVGFVVAVLGLVSLYQHLSSFLSWLVGNA